MLCLSTLMLFAQSRTRTYTFDFSSPSSLNPAIPPIGSEAGDNRPVTDMVFTSTDGQLTLSFNKGTSKIDALVVRGMDNTLYLDVPRSVTFDLTVAEGSCIKGVRVPGDDGIGGLNIYKAVPEYFDTDPKFLLNNDYTFYQWPVDTKGDPTELTKDYSFLSFMNGSPSATVVHKIIVDYQPPRDILIPKANIANNAVVSSFSGIDLTFDAAMHVVAGDAQFTLTNSDGEDFSSVLSASASGSTVRIAPSSPIAVDGTYTLTVSVGSFESTDGFRNQTLTYTFQVLTSFDIKDISLAEGEVENIPAELIVTFDGEVGTVNGTVAAQIVDESGNVVATGKASNNDATSIKLTFDKAVEENGLYTLTIPEKMVYDKSNKHFNSTKTYTYNIGDIASDELKAKAAQLLALTGIGYPTSTSAARTALSSLGAKASTADYTKAIADYLSSGEVELPVDGKFYKIASVSPGGQKLYLQYSGGQISLTTDVNSAVALRTTANSGSFGFSTPDGKGLQQLGSSATSIGDTPAALILAKLPSIASVDDETIFGLFSIYGSIGSAGAHALVNVPSKTFMTSSELTNFYFTETLSSAFKLELVDDSDLPEPTDNFVYDFTNRFTVYYKEDVNQQTPVKDVYLNNMTFFTYNDVKICPSDKEVVIVNYNTNAEVGRGRFYEVNPEETVPGAKSAIKLKLNKEITEGSLSAGVYSYQIYEGTFGDENFGQYNSDLASFLASGKTKKDCHANPYIYYILTVNNAQAGQTEPTPGPGEEEEHPSASVLAKAKELLGKTGVGYPTQTASTRSTLQQLVNSNKGSDATFNTAITNYLNDTNIEKPETGKYYTIAAVSADNTMAYVQEDGTLTFDATKAVRLKAIVSPDGIWFTTDAGKNLTVLSAAGSFTDSYNPAENSLTLARFAASSADAEKTFGLMTMQGVNLSTMKMSQVNVKTLTITTDGNTPVFTNDVTSAFRIASTDKPDVKPVDPTPAPTPEYTLSPNGGKVDGAALTVTLTFTNIANIVRSTESVIVLTNGLQSLAPKSVKPNADGTQFELTFEGLTDGSYTLNIGEGAFTFTFDGRTAKVQAISSNKFEVAVKYYPSEKVLEEAKDVLANAGIGYPAADSPARQALQQLVTVGEGTDEQFKTAIDAFKAETAIEKPANGKFYHIKAVGQTNSATLVQKFGYLSVVDSHVNLVKAAASASVFMVTANADGTITLTTVDGKYVALPASGDCVGAAYNAEANNLTLSRLTVAGVNAEYTFGFISLSLGTNKYATFDLNANTPIAPISAPTFSPLESSAIVFEEVSEADVQLPEVSYKLTPSDPIVETFEKATVSFTTDYKVELKDMSQIILTDGIDKTKVYKPISVTAVEGQSNTFDINFLNVDLLGDNRLCTLTIGSGAFVTSFMGREVPIREHDIVANFSIKKSITEKYDFETVYSLSRAEQPAEGGPIADSDLNNITLKASSPIVVLEPVTTAIIYKLSSFSPNAKGHFEQTDDDKVVKLVLETAVREGTLSAGTYHLRIPAHTFGDLNYAQYLADTQSISLTMCHVNSEFTIDIEVDNDKALGIVDVVFGDSASPVYDLMGRKVSGQLQSGTVYVRDGRKFTYKKK